MKRILLFSGLAESLLNFCGDLIQDMRHRGYEVHAAAPMPDAECLARLDAAGIKFHPVVLQRTGLNPLVDFYSLLAIRRICIEVKPDTVLAYTIKSVIYGLIAARLAGVHRRFAIITGRGYAFVHSGSPWHIVLHLIACTLYRISLLGMSGIFFLNPDDRDLFISCGIVAPQSPIHLTNGSGVNIEHFAVAPLPPGASFLMIARVLVDKGIREYFEAARLVKATHPSAELHLLGPFDPGPNAVSKEELNALVGQGAVTYHAPVKDVRPLIAAASVYVLPSYSEGIPRSTLEAMSMGRAVITTDAPGCRETVVPGVNGLIVPPRDAAALAEAMRTLADSAALRTSMGAAGRHLAEEKFDVRKVNRQMIEVLEGGPAMA